MNIAKTQISCLQSACREQPTESLQRVGIGRVGSRAITAIMAIADCCSKAFLFAMLSASICTSAAMTSSATPQEVAGNIAKKMMHVDAVLTQPLHREFWTALGELPEADKDNFVAMIRLGAISADEVQVELIASALASYRSGDVVETDKLKVLQEERTRQFVAMIYARAPLAERVLSIESFNRQEKIAQANNRNFLKAAARREVFHSPNRPSFEMTEENLILMRESVKSRLARITQLFDRKWTSNGKSMSTETLDGARGKSPDDKTVRLEKPRLANPSVAPSSPVVPVAAYKPNLTDFPIDQTTTRALFDRYKAARGPQEAEQILKEHYDEVARREVIMSRGPVLGYSLLYGPKILIALLVAALGWSLLKRYRR